MNVMWRGWATASHINSSNQLAFHFFYCFLVYRICCLIKHALRRNSFSHFIIDQLAYTHSYLVAYRLLNIVKRCGSVHSLLYCMLHELHPHKLKRTSSCKFLTFLKVQYLKLLILSVINYYRAKQCLKYCLLLL